MRQTLLFLFLILATCSTAQNYVNNPSFERDTIAPTIHKFNWKKYVDWQSGHASQKNILTETWFQPTAGTPDYLNSNKSHLQGLACKQARTGKGRMGMITGIGHRSGVMAAVRQGEQYAEYIETELKFKLEAGRMYCVRYYVALDKRSNYATRGFGAFFTEGAFNAPHKFPLYGQATPQVIVSNDHYITSDEGWVLICDTFIAKGNERFMTIGNFSSEPPKHVHQVKKTERGSLHVIALNKYAYYWLDDVSVTLVEPQEVLCNPHHDNLAHNNIVLIIDVSKSMVQDSLIASVRNAVIPYAQALGPKDRLSVLAYSDEVQVLITGVAGGETQGLDSALQKIRAGGGSNAAGALHTAYELAQKNLLPNGNNRIVLFTDGKIYLPKGTQQEVEQMAKEKHIRLDVLFFGDEIPKQVEKVVELGKGESSAITKTTVEEVLMKTGPKAVFDTPYSGRKWQTILVWQLFSKLLIPALVVGAIYFITQ
ncbi:MAG: VWA domain-containing protein [Bacteroidia bacterium]